jgi:enoyl-CoA hydratase/carnithine racemase
MRNIVEVEPHGRVLRVILNRPEKRNALSADLCRELADALDRAGRDPGVGAIVLSGAGAAFCAGMDVSELGVTTSEEMGRVHQRLFTAGARLATPLIAAVGGAALGGGTGLVANCHIVVAAEQATFGLTEIRLGLWPFLVFRAVAMAVGERRTLELALTGRTFDARAAREYGLVHAIAGDVDGAAMELAAAVAAFSPSSIRRGLSFVHEIRERDLETAGVIARRMRNEVLESVEVQEGIRAWCKRATKSSGPGGLGTL